VCDQSNDPENQSVGPQPGLGVNRVTGSSGSGHLPGEHAIHPDGSQAHSTGSVCQNRQGHRHIAKPLQTGRFLMHPQEQQSHEERARVQVQEGPQVNSTLSCRIRGNTTRYTDPKSPDSRQRIMTPPGRGHRQQPMHPIGAGCTVGLTGSRYPGTALPRPGGCLPCRVYCQATTSKRRIPGSRSTSNPGWARSASRVLVFSAPSMAYSR
jgi:hypothetical protein